MEISIGTAGGTAGGQTPSDATRTGRRKKVELYNLHAWRALDAFDDDFGRQPGTLLVILTNTTRTTRPGGKMAEWHYGPFVRGTGAFAAKRWPMLRQWWAREVASGVTEGFRISPFVRELDPPLHRLDRRVGCLVTRPTWWSQPDLGLIHAGMIQLKAWVDANGVSRVILPNPCGSWRRFAYKSFELEACKHLDERFWVCPEFPKIH